MGQTSANPAVITPRHCLQLPVTSTAVFPRHILSHQDFTPSHPILSTEVSPASRPAPIPYTKRLLNARIPYHKMEDHTIGAKNVIAYGG